MMILLLVLFTVKCFGFCDLFPSQLKHYRIVKKICTRKSSVRVVQTKNGDKYIVKQHRKSSTQNKLNALREIVVSQMAEFLNIPVNHVYLLHRKQLLFAKSHKHWLATLHAFVPGKPLNKIAGLKKMSILQKWKISRKGNDVKAKNQGLTLTKLKRLSIHDDIAAIAALDTFVGNDDRVSEHLYYDKKENRFWGIDLEVAFEHNLCAVMCKQIEMCIKKDVFFTQKELTGIKKYRDILKALMTIFDPLKFNAMIKKLADKIDLDPNSIQIINYKKNFEESFRDAQKLELFLRMLLLKHEYLNGRSG